MSDKNYRDYIELVRSRSPRPPFADVARLIPAAPARRATMTFLLLPRVLGIALLLGALATMSWIVWGNLSSKEVFSGETGRANGLYGADRSYESYGSYEGAHPTINSSKKLSAISSHTGSEERVLHEAGIAQPSDSQGAAFSPTISDCAIREPAISFEGKSASTAPMQGVIMHEEYTGTFFTSLGGAMSQQVSSNSSFRQTSFADAFFGVGYDFSEHFSVRILAGEEVFTVPSNTTINSISFHDTTFYHNGQAYQNVIGELQGTNTPSLTRTYWLGASYRYTMMESSVAPYAEILAGGATQGVITGATIGLSLFTANSMTLDVGAFFRVLIPIQGTTLTKFGADLELRYAW